MAGSKQVKNVNRLIKFVPIDVFEWNQITEKPTK